MRDQNENAQIWRSLYEKGRNDIRIPNDVFVRVVSRYLNRASDVRVIDVGMGTGANLLHLSQKVGTNGVLSHECVGLEISSEAILKAQRRFETEGSQAEFVLINANEALPFPTGQFDVVISWQVLCYNDANSFENSAKELNRILAPGGLFICATAAPGDISSRKSKLIEVDTFESTVEGQEGAIMFIPPRERLSKVFEAEDAEIGQFHFKFGGVESRHWIVLYRKGLPLIKWIGL